jgi:hypothetical protein
VSLSGLVLVLSTAPPVLARVEPKTYAVAGIGYASLVGDAPAAKHRDPGWSLYGGLRRSVNERITLGVSGELAFLHLNALEFFDDHGVSLTNPDNNVAGGDVDLFALTAEGIWNFPVERSTVLYAKVGAGYYKISGDAITLRNVGSGIEAQFEPDDLASRDESGFGALIGGGARFPLGENAGLWAEIGIHIIDAGGSMTFVPLRLGISLP